MRTLFHAVAVGLLVLPATAAAQPLPDAPLRYDRDHLSSDFHASRRESVRARLPEGAVAVLFGAPARTRSNDTDFEYRQDSDFYYLTGFTEPGAALVLVPGGVEVDGRTVEEILFVPPRSPGAEVWTGRRFGAEGAESLLGVQLAVENDRFGEIAGPLLADATRQLFHEDLPDGVESGSPLAGQLRVFREATGRPALVDGPRTGQPDGRTLRLILSELRQRKSDEELALLRRAIDITTEAHRAVLSEVEPGMAEYEIEALIEYTFRTNGAEHTGFPSIVGSGENSTILHYESNRRVTRAGDVIVIDIGAEYRGYSADVTRTVPVSGTFTREQRAIYDLVLEAQEAGIAAARVGAPFRAMGEAATRVLLRGMSELDLIAGPDDLSGLRRFFMHGTSHYIGLDVHDPGTRGLLEPGMVITVEPGIYIQPAEDIDPRWWNIGVRIEDDVLIAEDGPVLLSGSAPRDAAEVEAMMRGRCTSPTGC